MDGIMRSPDGYGRWSVILDAFPRAGENPVFSPFAPFAVVLGALQAYAITETFAPEASLSAWSRRNTSVPLGPREHR